MTVEAVWWAWDGPHVFDRVKRGAFQKRFTNPRTLPLGSSLPGPYKAACEYSQKIVSDGGKVNHSLCASQGVPEDLGRLQRLKILNLDKNQVTAIPSAILTGCAALQTLSLHSNPISAEVRCPVSALIQACTAAERRGA